jgi:hypothetical protein
MVAAARSGKSTFHTVHESPHPISLHINLSNRHGLIRRGFHFGTGRVQFWPRVIAERKSEVI